MYSVDSLQLWGDTLSRHGVLPRMGEAADAAVGRDPVVGTMAAVVLVVVLLAMSSETPTLRRRLDSVLAGAGSRMAEEVAFAQVPAAEHWRTMLFLLCQAVAVALLHYAWNIDGRLFLWPLQPWHVLAATAAQALAVLVLRLVIYEWVHSTFFRSDSRARWALAYRLSAAFEGFALVLVAELAVGEMVPPEYVLWSAFLSVLLVKLMLFWCAWNVFFVQKGLILHFFAYLCSAELIPLAVLWLLPSIMAVAVTA